MFRRALDSLGGIYERADLVVTFGDKTIEPIPERWRSHFERITVRYADPERFIEHSYYAQGDERWFSAPEEYDFAILSDADTMVLRSFDDLLEDLAAEPRVAGSIAHYPFPQYPGETPAMKWRALGREFLGVDLPMRHTYSFAPRSAEDDEERSPFYVNFGFVVVPRAHLTTLGATVIRLRSEVAASVQDPFFAVQIALTLAIHALELPHREIDIKYNFPNDPVAEGLYPKSLRDIRVIHYLRTTNFDRQRIFADEAAFNAFLARRLEGAELAFQLHVRRLTGGRYPF